MSIQKSPPKKFKKKHTKNWILLHENENSDQQWNLFLDKNKTNFLNLLLIIEYNIYLQYRLCNIFVNFYDFICSGSYLHAKKNSNKIKSGKKTKKFFFLYSSCPPKNKIKINIKFQQYFIWWFYRFLVHLFHFLLVFFWCGSPFFFSCFLIKIKFSNSKKREWERERVNTYMHIKNRPKVKRNLISKQPKPFFVVYFLFFWNLNSSPNQLVLLWLEWKRK